MGKILRALVAAVALAQASAAAAQVSLDVSAAFALPVGNAWGSSPWNPAQSMASAWSGAVPIGLAGRYHVTPEASLGVYFQWGPAFVGSDGFYGLDVAGTSGSSMRVGLELMYEVAPASTWNPWFSLGTGWEWASYVGSGASVTLNGWEWFDVQAGLDVKAARGFGIGPYVGFSAGYFSNIDTTGAASGWGGAIPTYARTFHGWVQLGLKGTVAF